jgi:hypothetical protein
MFRHSWDQSIRKFDTIRMRLGRSISQVDQHHSGSGYLYVIQLGSVPMGNSYQRRQGKLTDLSITRRSMAMDC